MLTKNIEEKIKKLRSVIREEQSLVVAFSGGVDSSIVAKVAYDELGNGAVAVTVDSETLSRRELEIARKVAGEIGIEHIIVKHSELHNRKFTENPADRCYFCKKEEMEIMKGVAQKRGTTSIAFGVNVSDSGEHRPGTRALHEENFFEPLVKAGIGKNSIPSIAGYLGLSNFNLPSTTCLASRIPYGENITGEKLTRIERAEVFLLSLGMSQVRVRNHMDLARIEVGEEEMEKLFAKREIIVSELKKIGFIYVSLDLSGYRSGSMDEVLKK